MRFVLLCWFLIALIPIQALSSSSSSMKKVLVTGANKGIGKAICQLLLEQHPEVHVLLGSRDLGRGEAAVKDIVAAVGKDCASGRLEVIQIDTGSDESVTNAAKNVGKGELYGIINNAGIGFGYKAKENIAINYFGIRRVNDAFSPALKRPGGRIVNVASASGPIFVAGCSDAKLRDQMAEPLANIDSIQALDAIAKDADSDNGYGLSKALVNAYTVLHAKEEPDLIINSVTPGYIKTDITKGMGATNPPSKGAVPPVHLLMSDEIGKLPTGRYYGSDCVRSPLDCYRGPGDPPFEGP